MKISLKKLDGRVEVVEVVGTDPVLKLKKIFADKVGIKVEQIRFIFKGQQLLDDKNLDFYNIKDNDKIHMTLQLKG